MNLSNHSLHIRIIPATLHLGRLSIIDEIEIHKDEIVIGSFVEEGTILRVPAPSTSNGLVTL
ncbi:hypothetical protein PGT21_005229 [Puccinia graminis f. sp. tritici]|uniref:Uncharacterized protein n=1 Tax=Puccinia graminis f. sp. tritici TaxID=56615 RepID=A0A5B0NQZ7_PUCGR|nr:hypothetical protein PGT21_005229 [Puccinia graminis f. sp. tritici]